ncbi:hypothetical protein BGZ73_008842, partial [Actinomortierella ambigua]
MQLGDLHADIKRITDKFFAAGPIAYFLDAFVKGEKQLKATTGAIRGLPRAWRRGFGKAPETRPSLLFLDLPDPSIPDSASRSLAAGSILDMVKENNRCGKTRAVIELLSQHWGFYFNASNDDWGSTDMMTLHSTVQKHLNDTRDSPTVDRQVNNGYARKTTLLLFLSRLLVFKYCLNVPGSSGTFTSARWTLLQVCPHVLFDKDIFNMPFLQLLKLRHLREGNLSDFIRDVYEDTKECLIKHGCLPAIKDDTRLLVIHDEAQVLGDAFNGSFQSMSSSDESPRPLLSPILHAFRDIGEHQLTLITCGTGLSINTLFWVQSSGSGLKDSSTTFEYVEFPGWTDEDSIKRYISRVRMCLADDQSKLALDDHLPQEAVDMLFKKFVGRYRPAIAAMDQLVESIDSMLGLLMYQRCMFGNHDLVLNEVDPQLVEHAFGRIKIIQGQAVTVMDESFVSKAVENYFVATDPYFKKEVRKRMMKSTASEKGCFQRDVQRKTSIGVATSAPISEMCSALIGKVEIVGWREPGLEQGTTHAMMSMEDFMDAHVNHQSTRNNMPVAPFFFPKSKPSGPDLLFFIRIDGCRMVPIFVQMKLHQGSSNFSEKDWNNALSTVSAAKIESHAKNFRKYCPDNVYISMIVAYPTKWTDKLPAPSELPKDASGVQQVVINVSDNNFGDIFPREH